MLINENILGKYYITSYEKKTINIIEQIAPQADKKEKILHKLNAACFVSYQDLSADKENKLFKDLSFRMLKEIQGIEVLLIGTGEKHRFPAKEIYCQLGELPFSIDFMNTHAACRTFNILINESRKVGALLFID